MDTIRKAISAGSLCLYIDGNVITLTELLERKLGRKVEDTEAIEYAYNMKRKSFINQFQKYANNLPVRT